MITIIVGIVCFLVGAEVECYLWKRDCDGLRTLVKELADELDDKICKTVCDKFCTKDEQENCVDLKNRALIAKAREMIGGVE